FFFQAEDGIRDFHVTGVQTCALPISGKRCTIHGFSGCPGKWIHHREGHCCGWRYGPGCCPGLSNAASRFGSLICLYNTTAYNTRSEEHTSELQSRENLVCRLLLEKKK